MGENTSFPAMSNLVYGAVDTEEFFLGWEDRVELGFLNIRLAAINGFQSCVSVEREAVWSVSKHGACIPCQ